MTERVIVRRGAYHDSVTLMLVSREAAAEEGAETVSVAMATPLNVDLIAGQGFELPADVGPNDLVIAIRAADEEAVLAAVERALSRREVGRGEAERPAPRSLVSAVRRRPDLNLAFLSVPGRHVGYEAAAAVEAGLHVFCFSDGLGLEQEAALKRRALERGLLFMGADCGTAIIDGVALGFANAVQRGPVGIVGASGTGTQEVCCLLDAAGIGISHAIGVGGRDLSAEVGGTMFRRGIELLAADEGTEAIVAISKPPDPDVAAAISEAAERAGKPVVMAFLGLDGTLEQAAARAAQLVGGRLPTPEHRAPCRARRGLHPRPVLRRHAVRRGDGDRVRARGGGGVEHPAAARVAPGVRAREPRPHVRGLRRRRADRGPRAPDDRPVAAHRAPAPRGRRPGGRRRAARRRARLRRAPGPGRGARAGDPGGRARR